MVFVTDQFTNRSYYVFELDIIFCYFIHACKTLDLVFNVSLIGHPYLNQRWLVMGITVIISIL